jgi:hypothetical protein
VRRPITWPALLALIAVAALAGAAIATASAPKAKTPDVTELFTQAVATVRAQPDFARAVVLEADGSPAHAGTVRGAGKIVNWRFVFDNSTPGSNFMSATVSYRHGKFGRVVGHEAPFLEDVEIEQPPEMTLKRAVSLLDHAGYRDGFSAVTLRAPLGPKKTAPLYIFTVGGSFVGVNTKTGKVKPLS